LGDRSCPGSPRPTPIPLECPTHPTETEANVKDYNLQRAHDENPVFHGVPTISLLDGLRAVRLKLWDEQQARLVTFKQAHERRTAFAESAATETA
jgi:hypothetical protein